MESFRSGVNARRTVDTEERAALTADTSREDSCVWKVAKVAQGDRGAGYLSTVLYDLFFARPTSIYLAQGVSPEN